MRVQSSCPPPPLEHCLAPIVGPSTPPFFPSVKKAVSLARRIGIPPTIESTKWLEMSERTRDPCPTKRAKTPPKDNNVVSLESTEDELEMELMALVGDSGKSRYVTLKKISEQQNY